MSYIIFTPEIKGHFLEYIHHFHSMSIEEESNEFIFLLPDSFANISSNLDWPKAKNIKFEFFDEKIIENGHKNKYGSLGYSWDICRVISNCGKKYHTKAVFTTLLIGMLPFAPLLLRGYEISGIIYRIFIYDRKRRSKISLLKDKLKYFLLVHSKVFKTAFLLNTKYATLLLNRLYCTDKFDYIPDPLMPIKIDSSFNIRNMYGIPLQSKLFVHFGAMNTNKSTLEVLNSIKELPDKDKSNYYFIFAGKVEKDIKAQFYQLYNDIKGTKNVIVKDEFCSYSFFGSLCEACDAIIIPYKRTAQSSGLIGYSSQFGKPVIAPNEGLLGELVKYYKLGLTIGEVNSQNLISAYSKIAQGIVSPPSNCYCKCNSVEAFQNVLKKYICQK